MNILLSLLIYNPIEAYAMILLCDIITGNKTRICFKLILYLYIFGAVNLFIQNIPNIWINKPYFALISIFTNYIITPFSIRFFYTTIGNRISYGGCFVVGVIDCLFIIVMTSILNFVVKDYDMFCPENKYHELISNFIIFSVQTILYLIIRVKGEYYYEKFRKGNC